MTRVLIALLSFDIGVVIGWLAIGMFFLIKRLMEEFE